MLAKNLYIAEVLLWVLFSGEEEPRVMHGLSFRNVSKKVNRGIS